MTTQFIFLYDGYKKNQLIDEIYIKNLPDNLSDISLELDGQTYFKLDRVDIETCYKNNTNIITFWGFTQPVPIMGKIIIKYNDYCIGKDNCIDKDILYIKYTTDNNNIWNKVIYEQKDFIFYDKRIKKQNYLKCKNGSYGIAYCL